VAVRPIDVSMPLFEGMPAFPGDPSFSSTPVLRRERGDAYNLSRLTLGSHAGTHLDPPSHFLAGGAAVDRLDPELLVGPCEVLGVDPARRSIGAKELAGVRPGTVRLLLRTANSERWARRLEFFEDFVALEPEAADRLLELGVRLIGIDALSIETGVRGEFPVHQRLLSRGTIILEGLLLHSAAPGPYELLCLPLAVRDGDGGPARVLLRPS
jgi:arylformamidase